MVDVRARNRSNALRAIFRPGPFFAFALLSFATLRFGVFYDQPDLVRWVFANVFLLLLVRFAWGAWKRYRKLEFVNQPLRTAWEACVDRHKRFVKEVGNLKKSEVASLTELPHTIRSVFDQLYLALRRADIVMEQIVQSESKVPHASIATPNVITSDATANELFRIADRNLAEYRQTYGNVVATIRRTEAQAAVFITTLDTLRVKMLGYRLASKQTALPSDEMLAALGEAKMQLDAIDKALDEIALNPFANLDQVPIVPPPMPESISLRQGDDS